MPYSTYADLIKVHDEQYLIQLSDDNGDGQADTPVIDEAIAKADAEINARVSNRYSVPLNPVPALATSLSAILAIGALYSRRGMEKPESVKDDVASVVRLLDRIGDGRASWGEATEPAPDTSTLDVRITSQPRVFSRDSTRGY